MLIVALLVLTLLAILFPGGTRLLFTLIGLIILYGVLYGILYVNL